MSLTTFQPGGNVGTAIIKELLKDTNNNTPLTITALTRPTSPYTPPPNTPITHRTVDYTSPASLVSAFTGQDAVVNCVTGSATQFSSSKLIIDAAVAAGVKVFFANEFVSHMESEQYRRLPEAYVGAKVRIRGYLTELGGEGKIGWMSLNGGPFLDMWLAKGPAGFDIANRHARIYGTGNHPLYWTPLPTIGLAAANMLRNPDAVANRAVYICPFAPGSLTQNILLSTLEKVLDTKFTIENVDVAKINENARIALEREEGGKAMKGLAVSNQFFEEDSGNDFGHLIDNEAVGVEMMSVEDAVRDVVETYGPEYGLVEGMFRVEPCEI